MYTVTVGNIGEVYSGSSLGLAWQNYNEYVQRSKDGIGKAAGESVTLFAETDGQSEIVSEYEAQ